MPLTNSQYDEIIRAYDARQLKMNMTGKNGPVMPTSRSHVSVRSMMPLRPAPLHRQKALRR